METEVNTGKVEEASSSSSKMMPTRSERTNPSKYSSSKLKFISAVFRNFLGILKMEAFFSLVAEMRGKF